MLLERRQLAPREAAIAVAGDLDLAAGYTLEREIEAAFKSGASRVFIDLRDCSYIDSSGMAALIRPADRREPPIRMKVESIALVGARDNVREAIDRVRLDWFLDSYETIEEARGSTVSPV